MNLYDGVIEEIYELCDAQKSTVYDISDYKKICWDEVTDRSMILRSDMAYELGGTSKMGFGATFVTEEKAYVSTKGKENGVTNAENNTEKKSDASKREGSEFNTVEYSGLSRVNENEFPDSVTVIGKELKEIKSDSDFARIAVVTVSEGSLSTGNALYGAIRKFEYVRYHVYPKGFMIRVSSVQNKESVRVSKAAIKEGITFKEAGASMIRQFHKMENVVGVKIYYITDSSFPFDKLRKLLDKGEKITKAIDHILKDVKMDCSVCSLSEVCDEIEDLRKMHFEGRQ